MDAAVHTDAFARDISGEITQKRIDPATLVHWREVVEQGQAEQRSLFGGVTVFTGNIPNVSPAGLSAAEYGRNTAIISASFSRQSALFRVVVIAQLDVEHVIALWTQSAEQLAWQSRPALPAVPAHRRFATGRRCRLMRSAASSCAQRYAAYRSAIR